MFIALVANAADYDFVYDPYGNVKLYCKITKAATSTKPDGYGAVTVVGGMGPQGSEVFIDLVKYNDYYYRPTAIAEKAFEGAAWIGKLYLSADTKSVGDYAFRNCTNLTSIDIQQSVTFGMGEFYGCSSLEAITIPQGVTNIPDECFAECTGLKSLQIGRNVQTIGKDAFKSNQLTSLIIDSNYLTSQDYAEDNNLTDIFSIQYVYASSALCHLSFGQFVTSIGDYAFCRASLKEITIPQNVESVGYSAFGRCPKLATININSSQLVSKDYIDNNNLFFSFGLFSCSATVVFGEGIESIGKNAFANNFGVNGGNATNWANYANNKTSLVFPSTLRTISDFAFYKLNVVTLTLPEGLLEVGFDAFSNCLYLSTITIPSTLRTMDTQVFYNSKEIATIFANSTSLSVYSSLFSGNYDKTKAIVLVDDEGVYSYLKEREDRCGRVVMLNGQIRPRVNEDVNEDGTVNSLDVLKVYKYMQSH